MEHDTKTAAIKGTSAWAAVGLAHIGVNTWGDAAAMLAALYSFALICEWLWKRLLRPIAESRGWVKPKKRVLVETTDHGDL